ncbi:hypothetical protein HY490_05220 [Candidatus Woesearchaeota archaeon]|nr:hypothetical protein [Candidatus Woesearchaeota archaeon]
MGFAKRQIVLFILAIVALFVLSACTKAECKKDTDCVKPHFDGNCLEKKCQYKPLPGECGNKVCEEPENKCTCAFDCGECTGKVGAYLTGVCNKDNQCLLDVPEQQIKPVVLTAEQPSQGDKFKVTMIMNQPFNLNKDTISLRIEVAQESPNNRDRKITRATLSGQTKERQTVTIAEKTINKPLWGQGLDVRDELMLDFPVTGPDGELTNLLLSIDYEFVQASGAAVQQKTASFQIRNTQQKLVYAKPPNTYPCPDCDDKNAGTRDECGPETQYFCQHTPLPQACGNFVCDGNENKCTCASDCGPCTGTGVFTVKACANNQCVAQLKGGITIAPQQVFDDRNLNTFQVQTYFKYNTPFNTATDKFIMDTTLYQLGQNVGNVQIEAVRLLEGSTELGAAVGNRALPSIGSKQIIEIALPPQAVAEQERNVLVNVYYSFDQNGQKKGQFQKPLGKIVFISPQ